MMSSISTALEQTQTGVKGGLTNLIAQALTKRI